MKLLSRVQRRARERRLHHKWERRLIAEQLRAVAEVLRPPPPFIEQKNLLEPGYVYAPWVPFYNTPTVILDDFMKNRKAIRKYARTTVNALNFSSVKLTP